MGRPIAALAPGTRAGSLCASERCAPLEIGASQAAAASVYALYVDGGGPEEPLAYAEFGRIDWRNANATLSRVLVDAPQRGRGLGRLLIAGMLEQGFGRLRMHRIDLRVYGFNTIAQRLYESAGFRREGFHREVVRVGPEYWSEFSLALLAPEYAARTGKRSDAAFDARAE